jgi:glycosyltransferase involved in cell wall biosynthesis
MIIKKKHHQNLCLVTFPLGKSGSIPFSNLVNILKDLSDELSIITGGEAYEKFKDSEGTHNYEIKHKLRSNIFMRVFAYIKVQFEISYLLIKLRNDFDSVIFFIGGEGLILPALTTKLLRNDLIIILAGFPMKTGQINRDPLFKITDILSKAVFMFSDKIVVYSKRIIKERQLQGYGERLVIAHEHYLDNDQFHLNIPYDERKNIVGYVGTLSELKGIKNLIKAIPNLLNEKKDLKFIVIGDGPLMGEIKSFIDENKLQENVFIKGWVQHHDLIIYLNKFKLLVLPSYTEGLPNVIIEAMACGTPVLTNSVGAIPDLIKDNDNGFIMTNNSSNCIEKNVLRAIESPRINKIIENAIFFVEKEFSLENVRKKWEKIFDLY